MKKIMFLCALLIYASIALSKDQCGSNCIGRVAKVVGVVERINSPLNIRGPIAGGEGIVQGDKLKTGPDAYIKILMKDDTIFQLGAESEFVFKEFTMKAKNDRQAVYDISYGQLRAIFINKAKENDIKLKTPTVSLGIRGTEFALNAFQQNGVWQTDIALLSGQLNAVALNLNKNITADKFILEAGRTLHVSAGPDGKDRPFLQRPISPAMRQQLKSEPANGGSIFLQEPSRKDGPQTPNGDNPVITNQGNFQNNTLGVTPVAATPVAVMPVNLPTVTGKPIITAPISASPSPTTGISMPFINDPGKED
ncbi:MAG: FecR family protein [Pseudomonadota bacterium]